MQRETDSAEKDVCDICGAELQFLNSEWFGEVWGGPDDLRQYYICPYGCSHCACCGKELAFEQACDCNCPGCAMCWEDIPPREPFTLRALSIDSDGEYPR